MIPANQPHLLGQQDLQGEQQPDHLQRMCSPVNEVAVEYKVRSASLIRAAEGSEKKQQVSKLAVNVAENPARCGCLHERRLHAQNFGGGVGEERQGVDIVFTEHLHQRVRLLPIAIQGVVVLVRHALREVPSLPSDHLSSSAHGLEHNALLRAAAALDPLPADGLIGEGCEVQDLGVQQLAGEDAPPGDNLGASHRARSREPKTRLILMDVLPPCGLRAVAPRRNDALTNDCTCPSALTANRLIALGILARSCGPHALATNRLLALGLVRRKWRNQLLVAIVRSGRPSGNGQRHVVLGVVVLHVARDARPVVEHPGLHLPQPHFFVRESVEVIDLVDMHTAQAVLLAWAAHSHHLASERLQATADGGKQPEGSLRRSGFHRLQGLRGICRGRGAVDQQTQVPGQRFAQLQVGRAQVVAAVMMPPRMLGLGVWRWRSSRARQRAL
mmetsp:Transcript_133313/g.385851  ORF Transcript_133313/g.385851 Transcript_133313/m.385851 type:complete len:444 (-) Transcript_133313:438-1769(-)